MQQSKKNKAQAMVVVFIYISVVSLMGIYMMVYAANLHNMVIREINHTKAFYAGETALMLSFAQGGVAFGSMTFGAMTVNVDVTGIGNNYTRMRATVSGWQQW